MVISFQQNKSRLSKTGVEIKGDLKKVCPYTFASF